MAYFSITYDLVAHKNYKALTDELTRIGGAKATLSQWFVEQDMFAFALRNHLRKFVDDDDKVVVVEFSNCPAYTLMFKTGAEWLAKRFK